MPTMVVFWLMLLLVKVMGPWSSLFPVVVALPDSTPLEKEAKLALLK